MHAVAPRRVSARNVLAVALAVATGAAAWLVFGRPATPPPRPGWHVLRPPDDVNALVLRDGRVIAGGRDGLFAFDAATAAPLPSPTAGIDPARLPVLTYVKALALDRAGRLWVGHRGGVLRLDGDGRFTAFAVDPGRPPGPVAALLETAAGEMLVGGEAGLAIVRDGTLLPLALPETDAGTAVTALHEDRRGRLWVGLAAAGRGGLFRRDGDVWRGFGAVDGLTHTAVNAIDEDHDGRLLVATGFSGRGGACRETGDNEEPKWRCVGARDGLASDMVRLFREDRRGRLWYGSEFDGTVVATARGLRRIDRDDGQAGTELKALLEDGAGGLWLGCDKGLTRIEAAAAAALD